MFFQPCTLSQKTNAVRSIEAYLFLMNIVLICIYVVSQWPSGQVSQHIPPVPYEFRDFLIIKNKTLQPSGCERSTVSYFPCY